jgi:non-canonical (house-cleaning) NTP pyrophosphatase
MPKIFVAVGSVRRPKLEAVSAALAAYKSGLESDVEFAIAGVETPSGVRHTPLSRRETMQGARQRAEALRAVGRERGEPWRYFVGLEGGLDVINLDGSRHVFLENWAYVADAEGRGFYGQSGAILLPDDLAAEVMDREVELGEAIDAFAGGRGIRDGEGAWGILTGGRITRCDAFRISTINAFAPLFNRKLYTATKV